MGGDNLHYIPDVDLVLDGHEPKQDTTATPESIQKKHEDMLAVMVKDDLEDITIPHDEAEGQKTSLPDPTSGHSSTTPCNLTVKLPSTTSSSGYNWNYIQNNIVKTTSSEVLQGMKVKPNTIMVRGKRLLGTTNTTIHRTTPDDVPDCNMRLPPPPNGWKSHPLMSRLNSTSKTPSKTTKTTKKKKICEDTTSCKNTEDIRKYYNKPSDNDNTHCMNKTVGPEAPENVPCVQLYSDRQQGGSNTTRVGLVSHVGESGL